MAAGDEPERHVGHRPPPAGRRYADGATASGVEGTAVDGFPADTITVALDELGLEPDLVVSGINQGQNVGPLAVRVGHRRRRLATAVRRGIPRRRGQRRARRATPTTTLGARSSIVDQIEEHRAELADGTAAARRAVVELQRARTARPASPGARRGARSPPTIPRGRRTSSTTRLLGRGRRGARRRRRRPIMAGHPALTLVPARGAAGLASGFRAAGAHRLPSTAVLRLVLPKGSLEKPTLELFEAADLRVERSSTVDYKATHRRPPHRRGADPAAPGDPHLRGRGPVRPRHRRAGLGRGDGQRRRDPRRAPVLEGVEPPVPDRARRAAGLARTSDVSRPARRACGCRASTRSSPAGSSRSTASRPTSGSPTAPPRPRCPTSSTASSTAPRPAGPCAPPGLKIIGDVLTSYTALVANPAAVRRPGQAPRHGADQDAARRRAWRPGARCS